MSFTLLGRWAVKKGNNKYRRWVAQGRKLAVVCCLVYNTGLSQKPCSPASLLLWAKLKALDKLSRSLFRSSTTQIPHFLRYFYHASLYLSIPLYRSNKNTLLQRNETFVQPLRSRHNGRLKETKNISTIAGNGTGDGVKLESTRRSYFNLYPFSSREQSMLDCTREREREAKIREIFKRLFLIEQCSLLEVYLWYLGERYLYNLCDAFFFLLNDMKYFIGNADIFSYRFENLFYFIYYWNNATC